MWTLEELAEINRKGDRIVQDPMDMVLLGNREPPDIPEDGEWQKAMTINWSGSSVVNAGRKSYSKLFHSGQEPYEEWLRLYHDVIGGWLGPLKEMGLEPIPEERGQFIRYEKGHYFALHVDGGKPEGPTAMRIGMLMWYVTPKEEYEGGIFRIPAHDFEFKADRGDYLLFPSSMYHEVTAITSGHRECILGEIVVKNWSKEHGQFWEDQFGLQPRKSDEAYARVDRINDKYGDSELDHTDGWCP